MKKTILSSLMIVLIAILAFGVDSVSAETVDSGKCGENLIWTLDDAGVLTISGSGEMYNYNYSPWFKDDRIISVIVSDNVTNIGSYAFNECTGITSVTIGNNVTCIGVCAFAGCTTLNEILIPDSVTIIDYSAFGDCTQLERIVISNNLTKLDSNVFSNTSYYNNAENWEDGVLYIGEYLLDSNSDIPNEYVIKNETKLIASAAFEQQNKLTKITIPDSVTNIGEYTFLDCRNLTSITIPSGITCIGDGAFSACDGLTSVNIKDIDAWCNIEFGGYYANPLFYANKLYLNDTLVTAVEIPENLTKVGNYIFFGCNSLKSVSIPNSVTSIGEYAFSECSGITSISIPDGVTSIGMNAFSNCKGLTKIIIPGSIANFGDWIFANCTGLTEVVVESGITELGFGIFQDCSNLKKVTLPNTLKVIGAQAFTHCNMLTDIVIPDGLETIGDHAFIGCSSLKVITIPYGVLEIGGWTFADCISLQKINIPDSVIRIGNNAFARCETLNEILIPDSVTIIETNAFEDCIKLVEFVISDNLTELGIDAFTNTPYYNDPENWEDGVLYIGNYLLSSNSDIPREYVIKDGTKLIASHAFWKRTNLTKITIPESVYSMGYMAFGDCSSLEEVIIKGKMVIGDCAFTSCHNLEKIQIDHITGIGFASFQNCHKLFEITIPKSVAYIGEIAFASCENLTDVYYCGTEEEWQNIIIEEEYNSIFPENTTIHFFTSKPEEYRINSITLKDMSGNDLSTIPAGTFLATVSFTNVSSNADTVIMLVQYTETGAFKGLMYIQTEDVPTGSTIKLSIPVDNTNGDVVKLKAFCWESFGSLTPMGNSASFPAG